MRPLTPRQGPLPSSAKSAAKSVNDARFGQVSRIQVMVRKRPMNKKEESQKQMDVVVVEDDKKTLTVYEPKTKVDLTKCAGDSLPAHQPASSPAPRPPPALGAALMRPPCGPRAAPVRPPPPDDAARPAALSGGGSPSSTGQRRRSVRGAGPRGRRLAPSRGAGL